MDGANADSDHSMTWEDFFGSTTDLTPTLIGIYDSFLNPTKPSRAETSRFDLSPKDARNDPPQEPTAPDEKSPKPTTVLDIDKNKIETVGKEIKNSPKYPSKIAGSVRLPGLATINKSSLYTIKTNLKSDNDGADFKKSESSGDSSVLVTKTTSQLRTFKDKVSEMSNFDNLSPNVKRMISSATETTNTLKFQKKNISLVRSSVRGHKLSNIPLVGATSKISQSGVEILPSVEIYDQPCGFKTINKKTVELVGDSKPKNKIEPEIKVEAEVTYDVPTNNKLAIYDVPSNNKTAFESLSLPYIDQSLELATLSNDREFDVKLPSKDNSPEKPSKLSSPEGTPSKIPKTIQNGGTNSLHRKDFAGKNESPIRINLYPDSTASTGNLKLCDKDRLQPPSVEVTRPLSMSSIASSSSTSSSGVQNKGGVNSAYLASIESLDDHSDVDITSAAGSNNFVNDAGVLSRSVSEEKHTENIRDYNTELPGLTQLERVCAEIVQTENVYVDDLRQVVEGYLTVWRQGEQFSQEQLTDLFNNIEDIYAFNKSLCAELNTCQLDAACIARCFVLNTEGFGVYTSYCTGYPCTMARLAELAAGTHTARLLRDRQTALEHRLPLASYLLKPVQRILKYHLLLQKVVKLKSCRDTEAALRQMTAIAHHIDDMKRRHEHAVRVQEIQSLLYGWSGPDLTTYGELCAEGTFRVFGAKAMRHAFLFDKMLLITKNREDGILAYKSHIMCNNMMLVECIAGAPLSFHVIPWDAPRSQLTLQARSQRHKREWTLLLKRVILENYNAVIPSHARQLVMELGQNKTDDDILAEKSHNLITQASMRKQLSAPEYLEKRKLERERRKSFDNGTRDRVKKIARKHTIATSNPDSYTISCDCAQYSTGKELDYICESCYIDLCSDCETEQTRKEKENNCTCNKKDGDEKCPECDRSLHYIDAGSAEHLERKSLSCKCSDFKSSQESVGKEFSGNLNRTRGYHSSDNIVGYTESSKEKEDLSDTNSSYTNVRNIHKTCLKCDKIKENIAVTDSTSTLHSRKSRCAEVEKFKMDNVRSKSKDDVQRSRLSKIGTWRRKSEPGLQQNSYVPKRSLDSSDHEKNMDMKGFEKIEFECRNCGSNKITGKSKTSESLIISDPELDTRRIPNLHMKQNLEIKMYNSKHIPKKISKIKKSRAKGLRLGSDTTAKFYADFSTDVSTENILHISESNDSINAVDKMKEESGSSNDQVPIAISKDEDMDEETYKKLLEKTDSFKKNELEKVKYLNQQKVINEGTEIETERHKEIEIRYPENAPVQESCDEVEQPLEQIISQLLMQNREFQKLLKKQQLRNSAQRRHQRLLKSYSNPDQGVTKNKDQITSRPKLGRQTSENLERHQGGNDETALNVKNEASDIDDDHIYETLRVENTCQSATVNYKNDQNSSITTKDTKITTESTASPSISFGIDESISNDRNRTVESDYVYLSFERLSNCQETEIDVIYDVPQKIKEKSGNSLTTQADYYVTVEKQSPQVNEEKIGENIYDTVVEVRKRQKQGHNAGEYLAMGSEQSPNTTEIWLSRQKEHFNMTRDRKSGSLPRSFQVITPSQEENSLSTFKCKPSNISKTYLNKDGKVVSMDRPFTIASDKSELSYDDVENYMSDGDILKFNKNSSSLNSSQEVEYSQNISKSTLELEEEIDRCYKSNFENVALDPNKNDNLTASQPNLNTSITSSCEMLTNEISSDTHSKDINIMHPEHKIYKPTGNILSLKNVLNRFKNKNANKSNTEDNEINSNEKLNFETPTTDLKSPSNNEKRSMLNPRNYSRNLLQRFRSIISDEQSDDNLNRTDPTNIHAQNEIKVVITSTDVIPAVSTTVYTINSDSLSKSVCENTTLTESQTEKNNLESMSNSYVNFAQKPESDFRPCFEKSVSTVIDTTSGTSSPSRSYNSSYQNLNKLPIYMQGSKHLGARIAQSDYIDPTTLIADAKSGANNVNILINKNSVRPDSLFSNSSFVTSSSEGTYCSDNKITNIHVNEARDKQQTFSESTYVNSDESFYEKSFEKIEHVTDEDVFRDSAVYSDQEDGNDIKTGFQDDPDVKSSKTERSIRQPSLKSNHPILFSNTKPESKVQSLIFETASLTQVNEKPSVKSKVAPPVPVKPKIVTQIPTVNVNKILLQNRNNLVKTSNTTKATEDAIKNTRARFSSATENAEMKKVLKPDEKLGSKEETNIPKDIVKTNQPVMQITDESDSKVKTSSIQMKRMSFERTSLDSATRKTKPNLESRRSTEVPKLVTKSVLERRMEIESISRGQSTKPIQKSQMIKPKVYSRVHRSNSNDDTKSTVATERNIPASVNQNVSTKGDDQKGSWVKQVVNKFQ